MRALATAATLLTLCLGAGCGSQADPPAPHASGDRTSASTGSTAQPVRLTMGKICDTPVSSRLAPYLADTTDDVSAGSSTCMPKPMKRSRAAIVSIDTFGSEAKARAADLGRTNPTFEKCHDAALAGLAPSATVRSCTILAGGGGERVTVFGWFGGTALSCSLTDQGHDLAALTKLGVELCRAVVEHRRA